MSLRHRQSGADDEVGSRSARSGGRDAPACPRPLQSFQRSRGPGGCPALLQDHAPGGDRYATGATRRTCGGHWRTVAVARTEAVTSASLAEIHPRLLYLWQRRSHDPLYPSLSLLGGRTTLTSTGGQLCSSTNGGIVSAQVLHDFSRPTALRQGMRQRRRGGITWPDAYVQFVWDLSIGAPAPCF